MERSPEHDYQLDVRGRRYRLVWVGLDEVPIDRVRALAFSADGRILLVSGVFGFQFPGGGLEANEGPADALERELWEEARARVIHRERLGAYRIEGPEELLEFHDYYWCRVHLEDQWDATEEISERVLVDPDQFVDTLGWGESDLKVNMLLSRALAAERSYQVKGA
jgi:8-oxo-dGTP pyrophosphatase MutT (NUDIX family)